jgi:hypothetical protein
MKATAKKLDAFAVKVQRTLERNLTANHKIDNIRKALDVLLSEDGKCQCVHGLTCFAVMGGYFCTLAPDHKGKHIACTKTEHAVATWY